MSALPPIHDRPLEPDRPSMIALTDNELKVLAAAVYNGQLSGKLKTFSGLTPSMTADIAADLFDRIKWHLEQDHNQFHSDEYDT